MRNNPLEADIFFEISNNIITRHRAIPGQWRFLLTDPIVLPLYTMNDTSSRQKVIKNLQKSSTNRILEDLLAILNAQVETADRMTEY